MSSLSYNNIFDSSGNNPTLVAEMIENESDRCRIAKSLNIKIRSGDLQKDYIYRDMGRYDQYIMVFQEFFNAVSEKAVLWDVLSDGTLWELSDLDSPEGCNSHPVSDKKKKKKGKKKNQKRRH
ncbi:5700_t:CDS:2 [Funneliformis geosporum]|nr:5700_t:CDS:2 [Funneliformis geosporum]